MLLFLYLSIISAYVLDKNPSTNLTPKERVTSLVLVLALINTPVINDAFILYNNILNVTVFSSFIDNITLIAALASLVLQRNQVAWLRTLGNEPTLLGRTGYNSSAMFANRDLFVVMICGVTGSLFLTSSINLLMLMVAVEVLSQANYVILGLSGRSAEVNSRIAVRYYILSALASVTLLLGITNVYTVTLSMDLPVTQPIEASFGNSLICIALLFKLGAAPLHYWLPDVLDCVTDGPSLWLALVTKPAILSALLLFSQSYLAGILVGGMLSLAIGSVYALWQLRARRLLAYASIAQIGYLLLVIATGSIALFHSATIIYLITYVLATIVLWLLLYGLVSLDRVTQLGYSQYSLNWFAKASCLIIALFSSAGMPPLVGFTGKLLLVEAVISTGHYAIALFIVLGSLVSSIYYISLIRIGYFVGTKPLGL